MPAPIDLTGQRFGLWTAVRRSDGPLWVCRCDCGMEKSVDGGNLRNQMTSSCGHNRVSSLAGRVFGSLTVLARSDNGRDGKSCWVCRCACGEQVTVRRKHLSAGSVRSCGCLKSPDLTGKTFERLTVLGPSVSVGLTRWVCTCSCGTVRSFGQGSLLRGHSRSCGCLQREQVSVRARTHGLTGTREFRAMHAHKRRTAKSKAGGSFTVQELRDLHVKQRGTCVYCPEVLPLDRMEADHIVPVSRNGHGAITNIQLLCRHCNRTKHNKTHAEFLAYLARREAA